MNVSYTYVVALMRVKSSLSCCSPLHALVIKMASSAFSQMGTICLRRGANTGFRIRDTQHKYRRHSVQVSGFPRTEGRISILWPHHCRGMLKDRGLGRYEGPRMMSWRRNRDLLVTSCRHVHCSRSVEIVRMMGGGAAVVLRAAVDGEQISVAVGGGWLDVLHPSVEASVFQTVLGLVSQGGRELKPGHNAGKLLPQVSLPGGHRCRLIVKFSSFPLLASFPFSHLSFSHLPLPRLSLTSFTFSSLPLANFTFPCFTITDLSFPEKPLFSLQQRPLLSSLASIKVFSVTSRPLPPLGKVIGAVSQISFAGKSLEFLPLPKRAATAGRKLCGLTGSRCFRLGLR